MPAMTMLFKVTKPQDLETLQSGMSVEFDVVNGPGGFEIPRIQPVAASSSNMESDNSANRICYKIGPVKHRSRAQGIGDRYRGRGATSRLSSDMERIYLGDMVYIDGFETREAALAAANGLEESGITDYRIIDEPGKRNALSLGVFGQKANANRLVAKVGAMNYSVKTEARYREQVVYWLHNEQAAGSEPLNLLESEETESGIRQISGSCDVMEEDA